MELMVMWIICLSQFAVIGWLAYPRFVADRCRECGRPLGGRS